MVEKINTFEIMRFTAMTSLHRIPQQTWLDDPVDSAERLANREAALLMEVCNNDPVLQKTMWMALYSHFAIAGRWAACGFPTVTLGHKTAALLMSTTIKPDVAEEFVKCPWPAFVLQLPSPLLKIMEGDKVVDASLVGVAHWNGKWWYKLMGNCGFIRGPHFDTGISLWAFHLPTRELAMSAKDVRAHSDYDEYCTFDITDSDDRTTQLMKNLIIGACIYLSNDAAVKPEGVKVTHRYSKTRPGDLYPPYQEFALQSKVKIDLDRLLADVREYAEYGAGRSPSVRTFVGGYWKRQHYGKDMALRRLQHIEGFWRGPKEGPLTMRTGK